LKGLGCANLQPEYIERCTEHRIKKKILVLCSREYLTYISLKYGLFISEIIKLAKGESESQLSRMTQCEQDTYEMHVRAANIVRAGESLMKLVSDIKQYLILNDFPSVNEAIAQNSKIFRQKQAECDQKLMSLRDDMAADLYDLEEEYYTSSCK